MKKKDEVNVEGVNRVLSLSEKILNLLYIALIVGIVLLIFFLVRETHIFDFLLKILSIVTPLFIGFIVAWLLSPLVNKLTNKGLNRTASCLIVFLIFVACVVSFFAFLFPVVFQQLNSLIGTIPAIADDLQVFADSVIESFSNIDGLNVEDVQDIFYTNVSDIFSAITNSLPSTLINFITGLFSGIGTVVISLVVALYILIDFDHTREHLIKLLPKKYRFEYTSLIDNIGFEIRRTVNGTLLVSTIVFVITSIGFTIVGLEAPLLFGLFCGITNLIPYIGPYIGGGAAAIVGFTQSVALGIAIIVIALIVQLLESTILQPMVMSKTMKLHPVTIIIGLLIFGYFFGIVGMILATPCMALIKVLIRFFTLKYNLFEE